MIQEVVTRLAPMLLPRLRLFRVDLEALPLVLAQPGGVRVTLAYVVEEAFLVPIHVPSTLPAESMKGECQLQAEAYQQQVANQLDLTGVEVVEIRVILDDNPSQGLLRFCVEGGVGLVAISTHGAGGVARCLLGSVADKLVRAAPVPVLVTRRPGDERD